MQESCSTLKLLLKEALRLSRHGIEQEELKIVLASTAVEIIRLVAVFVVQSGIEQYIMMPLILGSCRLRLSTKQQIEEVEVQKAKTADSKTLVDASSLQLQSLLYEKNYYNKEIASCRSFQYAVYSS